MARLYEGLWEHAVREDNNDDALKYQTLLFDNYPNLIPFSNLPFNMSVQYTGLSDNIIKQVQQELGDCNLQNNGNAIPKATVSFSKKGSKYTAQIDVFNSDGKLRLSRKIRFTTADNVAAQIAFSFFGTEVPVEIDAPQTAEKESQP